MGKQVGHPLRSQPPLTPSEAGVTPPAPGMRGNNDVRKMELDLCSFASWEEL